MDGFVAIVNGPNFGWVSLAALGGILLAWLLSKSGLLTIHTKYVTMGIQDKERDIIRQQQRWARVFLQGLHPFIKDMGREDYDDDLTVRCLDRATLAVYEWITLNHISTEEHYVQNKQDELVNLMYSLGVKSQYRTTEFRQRMENWIKELIQGLVSIRQNYK